MVYLSISARLIVNMEALNMAESIGNLTKHKRAPIVVKLDDGYRLQLVPVISGQSIAHGYQVVLAEEAMREGLAVCPLCRQGVFVKHSSREIIERLARFSDYASRAKKLLGLEGKVYDFEKQLVENCVVEDVGGFLYTAKPPVKRTSRFSTGYMVPAYGYIESTATDYQLHTRYDPFAGEETAQMIYYVELGSAPYTLTLALDLDGIGVASTGELGEKRVCLEDRSKRISVALRALMRLIASSEFGAKKSRFLPHTEVESIVATLVHPIRFNALAGHYDKYIEQTILLLESISKNYGDTLLAELHYYISPHGTAKKPRIDTSRSRVEVKEHSNFVDVVGEIIKRAEEHSRKFSPCE